MPLKGRDGHLLACAATENSDLSPQSFGKLNRIVTEPADSNNANFLTGTDGTFSSGKQCLR